MPSRDVRSIALIGTRGHYLALLKEMAAMPRVRLTALSDGGCSDPLKPVHDWATANHQSPVLHDDWRQVQDIDAAIICGPFEQHAEMAIEFVRRGVHVICEKPAALTMDDLDRLRETCERNPDVHVASMTYTRYEPAFYSAWQLIQQNKIGDVRLINSRKSYKMGRRPGYYKSRETYGSSILWVGSHAIDWSLWFAGAPVVSAQAMHTSVGNRDHGDMESAAACQFLLEGERMVSVSIDLLRPDSAPTHGDDWSRIVGTEGVIEVRPGVLTVTNGVGPVNLPVTCDRKPLIDFIDHIEGRRPAIVDTASSMATTEACLLARTSADAARAGSWIEAGN